MKAMVFKVLGIARKSCLGLAVLVLLGIGLSANAAQQNPSDPDKATDVTPLSPGQFQKVCDEVAKDINDDPADLDMSLPQQCNQRPSINSRDNRIELVLGERRRQPKNASPNAPKLTDFFSYRYANNTWRHDVVDTETGDILSTDVETGYQLPLTENEILRSVDIVRQDNETRSRIEQEYEGITGERLGDLGQLRIKAFILMADAMPGKLNSKANKCGRKPGRHHRCAQMVMSIDEFAFQAMPVVDLFRGEVVQDLGAVGG